MKEMTSAFTPEKRFESLKAAILCGLTTAIVAASLLWLHRVQQVGETIAWVSLIQGLSAMTFWASTAIAGVSGSLFGLTYRYAIRQDSNPQLKVGGSAGVWAGARVGPGGCGLSPRSGMALCGIPERKPAAVCDRRRFA